MCDLTTDEKSLNDLREAAKRFMYLQKINYRLFHNKKSSTFYKKNLHFGRKETENPVRKLIF